MIAWHYTTGQKFKLIIDSGFLMPTSIGVKPPEKPILWFSLNQYWENTANKAWQHSSGEIERLSMPDTFKVGGGLVRFGISPKELHLGEQLRRKARMSSSIWRLLCNEGLRQKAKTSEWCGTIASLPVDKLIVEVMDDKFNWVRVTN